MNIIQKEEVHKKAISDFICSIDRIHSSEFFSHSDLIKVPDVLKAIIDLEKFGDLDEGIAYENIPSTGYRYVYYSNFGDFKPESPEVDFSSLEASLTLNGMVFAADEYTMIVGVPEENFSSPYSNKFDNLLEDQFS